VHAIDKHEKIINLQGPTSKQVNDKRMKTKIGNGRGGAAAPPKRSPETNKNKNQ
jgi:hypothetical protein